MTWHMGSQSVNCHPTKVNVPRLNPSQPVLDLLSDGRLSWPGWLVIYRDGLPVHSRGAPDPECSDIGSEPDPEFWIRAHRQL